MLNVICCQFSSHWLTQAFIDTLLSVSLPCVSQGNQLPEVKCYVPAGNHFTVEVLNKTTNKPVDYFKIESFRPQVSRLLSVKRRSMGRVLCADWDNGAGKSPSDLWQKRKKKKLPLGHPWGISHDPHTPQTISCVCLSHVKCSWSIRFQITART